MIPVIAPVATGMEDNETFNVNGDTAAGAIAGALKADRLLLLTDVAGVKDATGQVVTQLHPDQVRAMIADGQIAGGMIPKTETALKALDDGVRAVVILDGRVPNACLLELFTEHGAGQPDPVHRTAQRHRPRGPCARAPAARDQRDGLPCPFASACGRLPKPTAWHKEAAFS